MQYRTQQFSFGGGELTPAVKFLLIANVAVFVAQLVLPDWVISLFGLVPALVWDRAYLWQLFTYQFFHGGLSHILFNMLALWMFGGTLENRWGSEFFLKYYFVSVLGGGILNTLLLPGQVAPSIGASAGIYGLLMAFALIYPNQIIYFYFLFPMKMKHFVCIIGGIALYSAISSGQSGIAHLAHLGGMAFGYLYLRGGKGFNISEKIKDYQDRRRLARLKKKFQVIPGGKDDDSKPTLH
ncbi:MAG: rhomboid family intramembrane serine protease [Deltaproteobacteria bacterium]|nr:rhomboid family intramembrane serine protease [Deltaproteobacteria bacterium]